MQENIQQEIEQLIQYSIGFADEVLKTYKEFYPFASFIGTTGDLVPISIYSGEEFPDSNELIGEFLEILGQRKEKGELIAYAIAIDTRITNQQFPQSIDAIAVQTFHIQRQQQITYYFPYRFIGDNVEILEGWGEYA
jgi:hypothetical protein